MIMMSIGTFCIGLIPSYASIGIAAPILLLLARLVQGFSTGGEYGGAATFIAEYSTDKRRGFMGSFRSLVRWPVICWAPAGDRYDCCCRIRR